MIKALPFANALAVVTMGIHVLGAVFALTAPGAYVALLANWMFLDPSGLAAGGPGLTLAGFVVGLVTTVVVVWVIGLALAALYNVFAGATEARAAR
ncbi:DUF5676 family membrane protein [Thermoflexus sp.]|uniref:DUF5676 family membrane protein n=1 Tax=Thermoflexus sp. TaxID=1969742 RepID=UPI0035E4510B